jgi:NAD(P)-dependent dehydrogenase (short-subunit alcohol dehydrogenase family)
MSGMDESYPMQRRVALVTGGASGIGLGIATALLNRGATVVIADIRADHIDRASAALSVHGERIWMQRLDVTDSRDWLRVRQEVTGRFGGLNMLCLNAGIGILGTPLAARPHDWQWVIGVNLRGVTLGLETFLPELRTSAPGAHILATSSMGGLVVADNDGLYACAKFGVTALMECLRLELAGAGIGVTTLFPAAVNTNIHDHAKMRPRDLFDTGLAADPEKVRAETEMARSILRHGADPPLVGARAVDAMLTGRPYVFTDQLVAPIVQARRDALLAAAGGAEIS